VDYETMKKILIIMQCWEGDKDLAMKLVRMMADIEPGQSKIADFMLSFKGCKADMDTARYLATKFGSVHIFHPTRKSTGWPASCNDCFFESFGHFYLNCKSGNWDYDVALFIEPDVVPLSKDWISLLRDEWYSSGKHVVGALYVPWGNEAYQQRHINGNVMIGWKFYREAKGFYSCPVTVGWDAFWRREMMKHGMASRLIFNDYARKSIECQTLFEKKAMAPGHPYASTGIQPVLYHGVKGEDAYNCVMRHFGFIKEEIMI
jgi:hypothetical protein